MKRGLEAPGAALKKPQFSSSACIRPGVSEDGCWGAPSARQGLGELKQRERLWEHIRERNKYFILRNRKT